MVLICAGLVHQASAQTFNRRYDAVGQGLAQTGWCVENGSANDYLVFFNSGWQDSLFYSSVVCSLRIDEVGEPLDTGRFSYPLHATYPGWANSSAKRSDGGFVLGGNTYVADGTSRAAIFLTDAMGSPEGIIEYGDVGEEWVGRQAKQTPDGGYVVVGETSTVGVIDAFLLKTDPLGNVEWVRTYGGTTLHDVVWSVDLDGTGGYFLGGQQQVSAGNYDQWVLHIDGMGSVIWQYNYGTPLNDSGNAHITTAADGNILFATGLETSVAGQRQIRLEKLDTEGSVLWMRPYGPARNTMIYVVQEIEPGGDLITGGSAYNASNFLSGILLRTTSTGDSVWMRDYVYYDAHVAAGRGAFRDVQPTPDGGFIAVGGALGVAIDTGGVYTQDLWVVKTDQYGCIEPGCHLIMGVETQITNLRDVLHVSPNPVAQGGHVQVQLDLPAGFKPQGALRITITDALGRLLNEKGVSGAIPNFINIQLPTGVYHLHLSDAARWISGAKLVVE